jgi:uncharacterized protein
MKLNQVILVGLTFLVSVAISSMLLTSWLKPQPQGLLNLYQSDLLLHASEGQRLLEATGQDISLSQSLLGKTPVQDALKQYQTVRTSAQRDYDRALKQQQSLETAKSPSKSEQQEANARRVATGSLIDELDLRLGILKVRGDQPEKAQQVWNSLVDVPKTPKSQQTKVPTAKVLLGLWSEPPRILPDAERLLQTQLKGWFRFVALSKLYEVQERPDALANLGLVEQEIARTAIANLLTLVALPALGIMIGTVLLILWGIRNYLQKRKTLGLSQNRIDGQEAIHSTSGLLSHTETVTWPLETAWQGIVLWFAAFFGMSILLPIVLKLLEVTFKVQFRLVLGGARFQAYTALLNYVLLMGIGYGIIQLTLSPFIPNALRWLNIRFRGNWVAWGLGGYFVALPIVSLVALLNQKLLQDQGGGNPILEIILGSKDSSTIALLWFMVAVLAPLFEESLFRGFFLTSLTRHLPTWVAIALSGFIFALAHLNLGDLLPLTVLGVLLGFVYLRSQNLLSSMLLHSLWNSGSFIGLLILGSANGN